MATKKKRQGGLAGSTSNDFCRSEDLGNEASVESFFVMRLIDALGYKDAEVRTKNAIDELKVGKGRRKEPYRPDFLLFCKRKPRWIIDAKATSENPDDYTDQGSGYCLAANVKYEDNPVQYFMLTNGFLTRVYRWDKEQPILSLRFADFVKGNTKFESLRELLGAEAARGGWSDAKPVGATHKIERPSMEEVKKTFLRCHRIIWKAEGASPQFAFLLFAKILFVKLWEDRKIRDKADLLAAIGRGDPLPVDAVRFSSRWIAEQEQHEANPVDRILFRQLVDYLEDEIQKRKRKRIFTPGESLDMSPGTVKRVVKELEHQYLFGIDEDLNGRMFEAFLLATMRGKGLGQYFTPRSVVKLMTRLGKPLASREKVERVLDGCCGTGGFLIEVLTEMRRQVYENKSLTNGDRRAMLNEVANEAIFGIDVGREPPLTKIARINMYLHGDGGSRVYRADALRKSPASSGDDAEVREEVRELRSSLEGNGRKAEPLRFDLVLTNPPFSMQYKKSVPDEWEVLKDYDLRTWDGSDRASLRSAVMFLERYYDLLKPGGRLLTVIDDSVLGGAKSDFIRAFLRERFIINGVISLQGDAFQRAGARTKTSVLCLTKRESDDEEQPDVFVFESRYIGLDDVTSRTPKSEADSARKRAAEEIEEIVAAYDEYRAGRQGAWLVPASRTTGRLDAKHLNPWSVTALAGQWKKARASVAVLGNLVDPVSSPVTIDKKERYTFLKVRYEGYASGGDRRLGKEISYDRVFRAQAGDLVVSHINAVNGAVCVLPESAADYLVTTEFTVLRIKAGLDVDPMYLWAVLRSPAVRAEWLCTSSGQGRHRVEWDLLKDQRIPLLSPDRQRAIGDLGRRSYELRDEIESVRERAVESLDDLDLYGDEAMDKLIRAKPPR
jgi:type I restriction enzyme M protein